MKTLLCVFFLLSVTSVRAADRFTAQLGTGLGFTPSSFYLAGTAEYKMDSHFSVGPMLQYGTKTGYRATIPTLNARLSFSFLPENRMAVSFFSGFGWFFRTFTGLSVDHFDFVTGILGDYRLTDRLSLGIGFNLNVTSSSVQRTYKALVSMVSYQF